MQSNTDASSVRALAPPVPEIAHIAAAPPAPSNAGTGLANNTQPNQGKASLSFQQLFHAAAPAQLAPQQYMPFAAAPPTTAPFSTAPQLTILDQMFNTMKAEAEAQQTKLNAQRAQLELKERK